MVGLPPLASSPEPPEKQLAEIELTLNEDDGPLPVPAATVQVSGDESAVMSPQLSQSPEAQHLNPAAAAFVPVSYSSERMSDSASASSVQQNAPVSRPALFPTPPQSIPPGFMPYQIPGALSQHHWRGHPSTFRGHDPRFFGWVNARMQPWHNRQHFPNGFGPGPSQGGFFRG